MGLDALLKIGVVEHKGVGRKTFEENAEGLYKHAADMIVNVGEYLPSLCVVGEEKTYYLTIEKIEKENWRSFFTFIRDKVKTDNAGAIRFAYITAETYFHDQKLTKDRPTFSSKEEFVAEYEKLKAENSRKEGILVTGSDGAKRILIMAEVFRRIDRTPYRVLRKVDDKTGKDYAFADEDVETSQAVDLKVFFE